jgi:hypothetical protein
MEVLHRPSLVYSYLYEPEISTAGHYEPKIPTAGHYEITASHYEFKNEASFRGRYGQNQNGKLNCAFAIK